MRLLPAIALFCFPDSLTFFSLPPSLTCLSLFFLKVGTPLLWLVLSYVPSRPNFPIEWTAKLQNELKASNLLHRELCWGTGGAKPGSASAWASLSGTDGFKWPPPPSSLVSCKSPNLSMTHFNNLKKGENNTLYVG